MEQRLHEHKYSIHIRRVIALIITTLIITNCYAGLADSLQYILRVGWNVGGTMPYGMSAEIRKLNSYGIEPTFSIGADAYKPLKAHWGVMVGLYVENKGMDVSATVKNYKTEMIRGGEKISGNFTGRNDTEEATWAITIPVMATYDIAKNVRLKAGPMVSFIIGRKFEGMAYNGYIRIDDPTGAKVYIGTDSSTRGTYDFADKLRRMQYGARVGADWDFSHSWGAYVDVALGFTGIFHSSFDSIEQTFYPIFATFGAKYNL